MKGAVFKGALTLGAALAAYGALADAALCELFSDGMVLQRGIPVPVWGSAAPGEEIEVSFAGQSKRTKAAPDGAWSLKLDPLEASAEPRELKVSARNRLLVKNALVGEVWLCSGQSNMEMPLKKTLDAGKELETCANPLLRGFVMTKRWSFEPERALEGSWQEASPKNCPQWPAVAYYFGKRVGAELGLPVGLIFCCWSGTTAQAWTPLEALAAEPSLAHYVKEREKALEKSRAASAQAAKAQEAPRESAAFAAEAQKRVADPGNMGEALGWQKPGEFEGDWSVAEAPGALFEERNVYGSVWYRKSVELPASWSGEELTLSLDVVDDFDQSYFNGVKIGATGRETDSWWLTPRNYKIPEGLAKPGRNLIAVRIFNEYGGGGFAGEAGAMKLVNSKGDAIPLAGAWFRKSELEIKRLPPLKPQLVNTPSALFNGMVSPLIPFAIKGALWYQGESNAGAAYEYRTLLPALARAWRERWGEGELPFHIVQLSNFMTRKESPGRSALAELREAQAMAARLPKASLTVTIDIGEAEDIHYKRKREAGERLALNALAQDYGVKLQASGPRFKTLERNGGELVLRFENVGKGLESSGGETLKGFAICGADGVFRWANAKIDGESVRLSSPEVEAPSEARYAWADNPCCELRNKDGLPAEPFRTDSFQGVTERR